MKDIYTFKFWKHKYGPELLVDIVDYAVMLPPIRRHPTFTETFYSVTIVLDADETISVDGAPGHIEHGSVVTSIPGEVWQFSPESQLKGFNLAFEKEFLLTFFITPNYLNRIIRRTLGKSAKEYIMDVVFEEACRRLRFTDMSIEEISETLGFETSTYFIRSFGKRYSVTPLQYRKSSKESSL